MRKIYKVQNFNINLHCYSFTSSCKIHKLLIPRTHPYLQTHVPSAKIRDAANVSSSPTFVNRTDERRKSLETNLFPFNLKAEKSCKAD